MLDAVAGKWIDVETDHLFKDQFNTPPIPGVTENGLRVMLSEVAEIKDDIREGVVKFSWCFGYDHNHDGHCDTCGRSDYLEPLRACKP